MSDENECTDRLSGRVTALASSVESSSSYLLRAIEETVDSLQVEEQLAEALAAAARSLTAEIRATPIVTDCYIDTEDLAINKLEAGYRAVEERLPRMLLKKSAIDNDGRLDGEQSELLHIAYDRCIAALAGLVEASKDLRASIISHDLSAEPAPSEAFDSPAALIRSLRTTSA